MKIKKGDYIKVRFIGRFKDSEQVFDVNDAELAKKVNLYDPKRTYKPAIVKVGERDVIQGLDDSFEGKELRKTYKIEISPEKGFGKKDAKLIQLIPASKFKQHDIRPVPGLQINVDNQLGIVKTVSGGRILVDFNHPLSGRKLVYEVTIIKIVKELKEQVQGYLESYLQMPEIKLEIRNDTLKLKLGLPKELEKPLLEQIQKRFPEIKNLEVVNK